MELQEFALKNMILKVKIGSHLYGTNTPESDEDYAGIFIPPTKYLIGLNKIDADEIDLSKIDKDDSGKNTKDAVDFKLYTLRKFVRLALKNNPNILDMLFVTPENIIYINDFGRYLLRVRHQFLSKHIKGRYLAYALSQKDKMMIKLENYKLLTSAYNCICENEKSFKFLLELIQNINPYAFYRTDEYVTIGTFNLPITITLKRAKSILKRRLSKFGYRQELVNKYGYDTKFASNLIRLLEEGYELLCNCDLKFPLDCADLIKDIRYGKYSLEEIIIMSEEIERKIHHAYKDSNLPAESNEDLMEEFVIKAHRKYIMEEL